MYEFTHRLPHEPWRKPSRNEEEYFRRREFRSRREEAQKREADRSRQERERLRELHRDRCPRCGILLQTFRVRAGSADQCPTCGGVWMDRETFERLTRRRPGALADLFREVFVEHSLGSIPESLGSQEGRSPEEPRPSRSRPAPPRDRPAVGPTPPPMHTSDRGETSR